ncbi:hypothetical protein, partial [Streptomyces sp. NPDC058953]|uniref:hypothetical protein n=1 Tax=Streptomyces sp. NPDC058953 TaxID=3346676 RepID=UPI00369F1316
MRQPTASREGPYDRWPADSPGVVGTGSGTDTDRADGVLRLAAGLLRPGLPALADGAVSRLRTVSAFYGDPLLAPPDLAESARLGLDTFLGGLVDPGRAAESGEYAWETGRRRASDGVPLQAVLHAYRIGGTRLWEELVALVVRECPDRTPALAFAAGDVWRRVDRDTALLVEAYRRVTAGLSDGDGRGLRPALRALLRGRADPVRVAAFAVCLGLPKRGRYAVALLRGPGAERADTDPVHEVVDGVALFWCPLDGATAVVAHLGARPPEELTRLVPVAPGARGGVSTVVDGLERLGRARELAGLALAACPADGTLHRLGDRLARAFVVARPDLAAARAQHGLGALRAVVAPGRGALGRDPR